ncbi:MAG: alpha/beta hydrolase [Bacteroidales bacterium]|nr:alpha/beta hydrolase [Bacteroidales bacterium]
MKKLIITLLVAVSTIATQAYNTISVERFGKGSPIIIIPGLGGTGVWNSAVKTLSTGNTCYVVSIKGIAGDKNPNDPNFADVQKDILDYIQKEKISNPIIMGHSLGGVIAEQMVISNPTTFKKLILVDSYPFSMAIFNPTFTSEIGIIQAETFKNQLSILPDQKYLAMWAQKTKDMATDSTVQKMVYNSIINSERKYIIEAQKLVLTNDLREGIKEVKCPIMVLCSSYVFKKMGLTDDIIKQRVNDQFKDIKDCKILINDNAKHFIMQDSKDWFIENLKKFI